MTSSITLRSYLNSVQNGLKNIQEHIKNVTVVIGNESCDLDSAVSSITYAYLLHLSMLKHATEGVRDRNHFDCDDIIIPILNVDRKNYQVKTEVKYFLDANKIHEDDIVFKDDIDLLKIYSLQKLKLVLVDHHVLQNDYQGMKSSIIRVLDHRPKDRSFSLDGNIVRIDLVGSCCTIVADEIIRTDENILRNNNDIANLLFGAIVLDTFCFDESLKRHTDLDVEMTKKCQALGNITTSKEDIYNKLKSAKINVSGLTLQQLLIKDMKVVNCIPISTLTTLAKTFLEKPDAPESVKSFCESSKAPVVILLGLEKSDSGINRRDLFIYWHSSQEDSTINTRDLADNIITHLFDYTLLNLVHVGDMHSGILYNQTNIELTRKHMLPIIENAYNDYIFRQTL